MPHCFEPNRLRIINLMEFKRIETRRILRYRELVTEDCETKKILEQLQKHNLEFSVKIQNMGGALGRCTILSMAEDKVNLFSNYPSKIRLSPAFNEIEQIEVVSNCDFIAEENDEGGRWSTLM